MTTRPNLQHKLLIAFCLVFLICLLPNGEVSADVGPGKRLIIIVDNAPQELYYLDLLYTPYSDAVLRPNVDDLESYDPNMLALLKSCEKDEKVLALVTGTSWPIFSAELAQEPNGRNRQVHFFSYGGIPDVFEIAIVTSSGSIIISPTFEQDGFTDTCHFDADTGKIRITSRPIAIARRFLTSFLLTLLIEGLVLIAFGFKLEDNWLVLLIVNFLTQLGLHLVFTFVLKINYEPAWHIFLFPIEIVIALIEMLAYAKLLKGQHVRRRVSYALVANFASFVLGLIIYSYIDYYLNLIL